MKLLVVIVNYRVAHLTIECLRSVAAEIERVPDARVAVCENGSGDDSANQIREAIRENNWSSWCALTVSTSNLGFTGGNNIILRKALQSEDPPQYVVLLNPDTIVRKHAFSALVDFMGQHPNIGIAGSRLENPDGTPQRSAFRFHTPLSEFERSLNIGFVTRVLNRWMVAPTPPAHACETDWVSGASMIVRCEVFQDIGFLDEGYFMYFDDADFCLNARKAGWPTWYVPSSRVVHLVARSTGVTNNSSNRRPTYWFEARRRYFLKNHGPGYAALADMTLILGLVLWRLRVVFGKEDFTPPHLLRDSLKQSVFVAGFSLRDVGSSAFPPPRKLEKLTAADMQ